MCFLQTDFKNLVILWDWGEGKLCVISTTIIVTKNKNKCQDGFFPDCLGLVCLLWWSDSIHSGRMLMRTEGRKILPHSASAFLAYLHMTPCSSALTSGCDLDEKWNGSDSVSNFRGRWCWRRNIRQALASSHMFHMRPMTTLRRVALIRPYGQYIPSTSCHHDSRVGEWGNSEEGAALMRGALKTSTRCSVLSAQKSINRTKR